MNHSTKRVQAFSDAVLAIAATVLAVPLAKIDETVRLDMYLRGKPLRDVLTSDYQIESFAMFIGSFILVYLVWVRHGRQFITLSREEYTGATPAALVITNMLELFLATLLPYTAASASRARLTVHEDVDERRALALPFCANIFALAATRVVFEALALRVRPSPTRGFFNLCEAVAEMAGSIIVLALASSILSGEDVFWPLLTVPILSAIVRVVLTQMYGESDHNKMDWHRMEGFIDGCVAVAGTLMVLEIKPPADCADMKFETCILHYRDGCRVKFDMDTLLKTPVCFFEGEKEQNSDVALIGMYFVCFSLMFFLWYAHHEVIWFGYAPPRKPSGSSTMLLYSGHAHSSSEGSFRALAASAWFCASIGLLPFAFSLVAEFAVKPYSQADDPRLFPKFEKPLDPNADRTACNFALGVLLSASLPIVLLLLCAPRRFAIPWSVWLRVFAFPFSVLLNILVISISKNALLTPLLVIIPIVALSNILGQFFDRLGARAVVMDLSADSHEQHSEPLLAGRTTVITSRNSDFFVMGNGESESLPPRNRRMTSASADAEYF